jgi:hypothetical protein
MIVGAGARSKWSGGESGRSKAECARPLIGACRAACCSQFRAGRSLAVGRLGGSGRSRRLAPAAPRRALLHPLHALSQGSHPDAAGLASLIAARGSRQADAGTMCRPPRSAVPQVRTPHRDSPLDGCRSGHRSPHQRSASLRHRAAFHVCRPDRARHSAMLWDRPVEIRRLRRADDLWISQPRCGRGDCPRTRSGAAPSDT